MKEERFYILYYGENKQNDYIRRYLKEDDIIDNRLSEAKAFNIFFDNMILCNSYFQNDDFSSIDTLVSGYNEEEDFYEDEYQFFIVDPTYSEDITIKAVEKMGNTLYYDNNKDLYIMGVTDLGTSRTIVPTNIKIKEYKEN